MLKKVLITFIFLFFGINVSAQDTYFVTAPNGLVLRDNPDKNANKITTVPYKSEVKSLENTKIRLDILDNGKLIEGEWMKVSFHDDYDIYTGYVFSGYLINENKLIVPHKKMGIVTNTTTKQDLYKICKEKNIKDTIVFSYEDIDVIGTQIIYPESPDNRIKIVWNTNNLPEKVWINEGDLKTISGISIGSTISMVEKANKKPFLLNGFEIDHYLAGTARDWKNGDLMGLGIQFTTTNDLGNEYHKIIGNKELASDNPYIQKARLVVIEIMIDFSNSQ